MTMKKILKEWRTFTEAANDESQNIMDKLVVALDYEAFHSAKGTHRQEFESIVGPDFLKKMDEVLKSFAQKNNEKYKYLDKEIRDLERGLQNADLEPELETQAYSDLRSMKRELKDFERSYNGAVLGKNGMGLYVAQYLSDTPGADVPGIFQQLSDLKAKIFLESLTPEETTWLKENFYSFIDETIESAGVNTASVWTGDVTARGKPTPKKGRKTVAGGQVGDWFWANPKPWPNGAYDVFVTSVKKQLNPAPRKADEPKPSAPAPEKSERAKELDDFFSRFYGGK